MLRAICLFLTGFLVLPQGNAFTCFATIAKDNCWSTYTVVVQVIDASNDAVVTTVTVPAGKPWAREQFTCQPEQKLRFSAEFSPLIWEQDAGKSYDGQHYWFLPQAINPGEGAWNISVCFPGQFSEVPMPPQATANCACDMATVPPVPLQKVSQ